MAMVRNLTVLSMEKHDTYVLDLAQMRWQRQSR